MCGFACALCVWQEPQDRAVFGADTPRTIITIMVVFIKGMECYKVDYNDNLERINARSSRSDRAMALVGAVDAVPLQRGEADERRIFA